MTEKTDNNTSSHNKRIAKNTIMLYFRMIVTTILSLITARYTLMLLGVSDYGVYNVVGGIVGFTGFITGTMSSATQRFLSYDLGKGDIISFQKTFSMLINLFTILCIFMFAVLEISGSTFVGTLKIPYERKDAAMWIYQFSIIAFLLRTMLIPYQSAIIAHERMSIYGYFTILDVLFKLMVLSVLFFTPFDKLISYGFIVLFTTFISNVIYFYYCRQQLQGCRYRVFWDTSFFKCLLQYIGWNLFGSLTKVLNTHGQSIILNLFFGPLVNAAKAIADKINGITSSFASNFLIAVSPQIIKSYASGNIDYLRNLVAKSSRLSFYLMLVISVPLFFTMKPLLELWLGENQTSMEMVRFSQTTLIYTMICVLEPPITMTIRATGEIKKYQICIGSITLSFIPLCYLLFMLDSPAYYSMVLLSLIYAFAQIFRVHIVAPILGINKMWYIRVIIFPIITTTLACFSIGAIYNRTYPTQNSLSTPIEIFILFLASCFIVFTFSLYSSERRFIVNALISRLKNKVF